MAKIHLLSTDLRNKIAAGEVVERPASVVKELVENSLDANATEITIVIEKGGHQLIQVSDNGGGISPDDMNLAVQRYTTNKIETIDDLFNINSLGFRGEALASIASVSEMEMASCINGDGGFAVSILDGEAGELIPAEPVQGTRIDVRNLFYNTPARKKFLKSQRVEFRQIVAMARRYGLAYPEVAFKLYHDDKEILNIQSESLKERINNLLDPTYSDHLLEVNTVKGDFAISGYVGSLNLVRSRPGEQYIFLNRRFIKHRLLNNAVYSAYQSLLKRGEYPFYVLNLVQPADQVDVNVHPMKIEVRFKDEWRLYHVLKSAVADALRSILDTIPDFSKMETQFPEFGNSLQQATLSLSAVDTPIQQGLQRAKTYMDRLSEKKSEGEEVSTGNIWQIHDKYIVSQINSGLVIIDQHVAHERVLFEDALNAFEKAPLGAQTLLFPETLEFSADEFSVLLDILPNLNKLGFRMQEFGKNTVMVEAIPSEMVWGNEKTIIRDIMDSYLENKKKYSSWQEGLAASYSCHAAVKAGDPLTIQEMQALVNRLFATNHPYYCPHGRPIIVQLSIEELDKRFERI
ncbi:MAG TPA: DNA mismatch repair endonuclease MutL [Candidatus Marinimicrobia bacterium]|jgi:DNA mismatch repair protein MutL|nr:DNA mismatch repair endonuclease MutL [Candidatus Neomarinimicrobiota bacterium]